MATWRASGGSTPRSTYLREFGGLEFGVVGEFLALACEIGVLRVGLRADEHIRRPP